MPFLWGLPCWTNGWRVWICSRSRLIHQGESCCSSATFRTESERSGLNRALAESPNGKSVLYFKLWTQLIYSFYMFDSALYTSRGRDFDLQRRWAHCWILPGFDWSSRRWACQCFFLNFLRPFWVLTCWEQAFAGLQTGGWGPHGRTLCDPMLQGVNSLCHLEYRRGRHT